jgi:dTDP-glucose pyrophosphorylase
MTPGTAIITMAGRGQRFRDAGYDVPKFAIVVRERTLFSWAMESLRQFSEGGWEFVFVARRADDATSFIGREVATLGVRSHAVVEIEGVTDGQATTALRAAAALQRLDAPVLIYNIDTHVAPAWLTPGAIRGEGWIPCFPGEGSAWSFARTDSTGRVLEVREKCRISPHATVGLYWFSSFALYRETYERCYEQRRSEERGERYVAPMYNDLIRRGLPVYIHQVPSQAVAPLGTPGEVERFSRGA